MEKINFENGSLVEAAKVTVNGVEYTVTPEKYSGTTPLDADTLNLLQTNIQDEFDIVEESSIVETGSTTAGTYVKYKDGRLVQYGMHTYNVSTSDAYYNIGYRTGEDYFGKENYPKTFTTLKSLIIDVSSTGNVSIIATLKRNNTSKLTKLPALTFVTPEVVSTSSPMDCSYIAIGTWK